MPGDWPSGDDASHPCPDHPIYEARNVPHTSVSSWDLLHLYLRNLSQYPQNPALPSLLLWAQPLKTIFGFFYLTQGIP